MPDSDPFASLRPACGPLTRRALVKASLSLGFCAAVAPVSAQTITTSAEGLIAGEVKVPAGDADIPAYRATPAAGGPFPTVLVVHEIFGVHEHIKDVCRRWARLGYYAIAPELFARQGDAAKEADIPKLDGDDRRQEIGRGGGERPRRDASLRQGERLGRPRARRGRRLLLGRAPGLALRRAQSELESRGRLVRAARRTRQRPEAEESAGHRRRAESSRARALRRHGQEHPARPDRGDASKLAAAGGASRIIVYADAGHAFYADYRPSYVKADAEASWQEATAWLKAHGV